MYISVCVTAHAIPTVTHDTFPTSSHCQHLVQSKKVAPCTKEEEPGDEGRETQRHAKQRHPRLEGKIKIKHAPNFTGGAYTVKSYFHPVRMSGLPKLG